MPMHHLLMVSLYIVFFAFLLGVVAAIVVIILITAILTLRNWCRWKAGVREAQQEHQREHFRPDGQPYPPAGRGLCERCQKVYEKIYYPPGGRRLCPECYEMEFPLCRE